MPDTLFPSGYLVRTTGIQETLNLLAHWHFQEWELPRLSIIKLNLPTREVE